MFFLIYTQSQYTTGVRRIRKSKNLEVLEFRKFEKLKKFIIRKLEIEFVAITPGTQLYNSAVFFKNFIDL